jgi:Cu-processing system ATP-binding protein
MNQKIYIENLSKFFGKQEALKNINLAFDSQQIVAVVGHNGSGKTTLMKCLLGLVIPNKGKILINGEVITETGEYRGDIGYMPQISRYPDYLKVSQLFEMMKDMRKSQSGNELFVGTKITAALDEELNTRLTEGLYGSATVLDQELIQSFELDKIFHKTMRSLSGGMKQKVGAALAFLFNPSILILDEPTAGLDPLSCEILKEKIQKEYKKGKLILITSHIMSDLDELATDILYLNEGKVEFFKPLDLLREESNEKRLGRIIAQLMKGNLPLKESKLLVQAGLLSLKVF